MVINQIVCCDLSKSNEAYYSQSYDSKDQKKRPSACLLMFASFEKKYFLKMQYQQNVQGISVGSSWPALGRFFDTDPV